MSAMLAIESPWTLVDTTDVYREYEHKSSMDVLYLSVDDGRVLVDFYDLDIADLYYKWRNDWAIRNGHDFKDWIAAMVTDPDLPEEEIHFCEDCSEPTSEDDLTSVRGGDYVCSSCVGEYSECECCGDLERDGSWTLYDSWVCDSCLENNYSYCDECDGYYSHDDYEHEHNGGCDCEAPAQRFFVRNDGEGMLANDTRTTVNLPAGILSDVGIAEIGRLLRNAIPQPDDWFSNFDVESDYYRYSQLSYTFSDVLDPQWQVSKGGNYTKRLSSHAYKNHKIRLSPEILSQVGNIGAAHSRGNDFAVELTRDLNLPAEEFAHEDSCWWQSYYESRCALKNNGGYGLRSFGDNGWGETVTGRAWVMPLKYDESNSRRPWTPTFNSETPDGFIVFNGYGDLNGYVPARIVAHMAGMTYTKVHMSAEPMYVNSDAGYLVTRPDLVAKHVDGTVRLDLDPHANLYSRESAAGEVSAA